MSILLQIIFATLGVSIISFIGVLLLAQTKHHLFSRISISLAAGALLGAVFFGVFPELFDHHEGESIEASILSSIILFSILGFFLIEKYLHWHHCHCDGPHHTHANKSVGYINLIGDGLHNFVDGALIATSFLISPGLGIVNTFVIMLHEIPQEIADFGILLYSGFSKKKALLWNFFSGITAVIGGIVTYFFALTVETAIPYLLAIAGGGFLYLAMADIMPELHHEQNKKYIAWQAVWLILGILLIYLTTTLAPHGH